MNNNNNVRKIVPKRIAMLSWESRHSVHVGGLAAHVTELSDALVAMGHEVHVFTRAGTAQPRYNCVGQVHYHRCEFEASTDLLTYVARMCDSFVKRVHDTEWFFGKRFDVLHGHDWLAARALEKLKMELHRPAILTMHSTEFGRCGNTLPEGHSRSIRDVEWQGTYAANRIICVSKALENELAWLYQVPADKMAVVYNGVNVERFDVEVDEMAVRGQCGVGADDPLLLFAGRLAWQKGPDLLLDSLPAVLDEEPDTKVVFAGAGDMRRPLGEQASSSGLDRSVRFLGQQNSGNMVALFRSADTLCVPSRNEPFGIVILEGWSASCPVVVTRNGGPAEFVRDRRTGLLVSAEPGSIADGVCQALGNREKARRLGRNGRKEAETRFTWGVIAAKTDQVYESVL